MTQLEHHSFLHHVLGDMLQTTAGLLTDVLHAYVQEAMLMLHVEQATLCLRQLIPLCILLSITCVQSKS